jgi:serine carboxypeptidase-like clade 2
MNIPEVQHAIHANISYPWTMCSGIINYDYNDVMKSVMPVYEKLILQGVKILVYSGDIDAIVPITGTRAWLSKLNLPIVQSWIPWTLDQQTGGYVTEYQGLTFSSVRGAGHMVPETQPERALAMFTTFLYGKPWPYARI